MMEYNQTTVVAMSQIITPTITWTMTRITSKIYNSLTNNNVVIAASSMVCYRFRKRLFSQN